MLRFKAAPDQIVKMSVHKIANGLTCNAFNLQYDRSIEF